MCILCTSIAKMTKGTQYIVPLLIPTVNTVKNKNEIVAQSHKIKGHSATYAILYALLKLKRQGKGGENNSAFFLMGFFSRCTERIFCVPREKRFSDQRSCDITCLFKL